MKATPVFLPGVVSAHRPSHAGFTKHSFAAYFPDLASNMLGSFVMGTLIASVTFELDSAKAVAALPLGHPWQVVSFLYATAEIILHKELSKSFTASAQESNCSNCHGGALGRNHPDRTEHCRHHKKQLDGFHPLHRRLLSFSLGCGLGSAAP